MNVTGWQRAEECIWSREPYVPASWGSQQNKRWTVYLGDKWKTLSRRAKTFKEDMQEDPGEDKRDDFIFQRFMMHSSRKQILQYFLAKLTGNWYFLIWKGSIALFNKKNTIVHFLLCIMKTGNDTYGLEKVLIFCSITDYLYNVSSLC